MPEGGEFKSFCNRHACVKSVMNIEATAVECKDHDDWHLIFSAYLYAEMA